MIKKCFLPPDGLCIKPTTCGSPDLFQYIQYSVLILLYIIFFILSLQQVFRPVGRYQTKIISSHLGKAFFFGVCVLCLVRIVADLDIFINMPESYLFVIIRTSIVPFDVIILIYTLSLMKFYFFLKFVQI